MGATELIYDRSFYGLASTPFAVVPDPNALFATPGHRAAYTGLINGIVARRGFVSLIADVGLGKSTLVRAALRHLDQPGYRAIYIFNPAVQLAEPLVGLLAEFGLDGSGLSLQRQHDALADCLIECYRLRQTVVLIIDEAHTLTTAQLETLRLLSNLEAEDEKLLQMVLVAQPELDALLDTPALRQLKQRIAVRCTLKPLGMTESADYLRFRLSHAGCRNPEGVLRHGAIKIISRAAGGAPRSLNILAENLLTAGLAIGERPIGSRLARRVVADLKFGTRRRPARWLLPSVATAAAAALLVIWLDKELRPVAPPFPAFQGTTTSADRK
jgi:general secretion pathway protein A